MENAKHAAQERPIAKRLVTFVTAVAACVALVAGGTLAYFSDEETTHNVITTGGVNITLNEYTFDDEGERIPFPVEKGVSGVMPGTSVDKVVEVENTGQAAAWVRVKVEKSIKMAEGVDIDPDLKLVVIDIDETNWEFREGWYYYKHPLPSKSAEDPMVHVTSALFTKVTFDAAMGNPYQNSEATVKVIAQAVQVANNGNSALKAAGWPKE